MKNRPNGIAPVAIGRPRKKRKRIELDTIEIKGAREHNLKSIDLSLPKKKLIVFTGVSGSGKSSLAFDTIFAEGQRRYVESLSAYARQFIGQMEKPRYDTIRGLSPTISIEQKSASKNPRSTVGTITEIYDYLRVLFARIGQQTCIHCGKPVGKGDSQSMVSRILDMPEDARILILAPIIDNRKGEHREVMARLQAQGYARLRVNGVVQEIEAVKQLARYKKHTIESVVDRLKVSKADSFRKRLTDSVETALRLGEGRIIVHQVDQGDIPMSEARSCCGIAYPELDPPLFSFNSPLGMCPDCNGIGSKLAMDADKVIADGKLSIRQGAIIPWQGHFTGKGKLNGSWTAEQLRAMEEQWGVNFDTPWDRLPRRQQDLLLYGSGGRELKVSWNAEKIQGSYTTTYEGLLNTLMRRYKQTESENAKKYYGRFLSTRPCDACDGRRLKPEVLAVKVGGHSIIDVTEMTIREARDFSCRPDPWGQSPDSSPPNWSRRSSGRLGFLVNVGLDYLTLDRRKGPSLSGGEAQRIRLASQVGSPNSPGFCTFWTSRASGFTSATTSGC